jgi:GNAT superfamily N-acetyltransferase
MIRVYNSSDFSRCREIVNEVWRLTDVFKPNRLADLFLNVYTGGSLAASNCAFVIEEAGHVEGFLFGKSGDAKTMNNRFSRMIGNFRFLCQLLSVKGVPWKMKRDYITMLNEHEVNRSRAEKNRGNEVQLFAVSPAAQGKKFGKALMQAYISVCIAQKVKRVTLDTDNECNFLFYEHFGYKRIAEFYSPIQKLYSGNDGTTFVYELKIE